MSEYIDIVNHVLEKKLSVNGKDFLINVDFQVNVNGTFVIGSLREIAIKPCDDLKKPWQPLEPDYIWNMVEQIINQELANDQRMIDTVKDAINTALENEGE